eukprot:3338-Amphidinium_carterae.2
MVWGSIPCTDGTRHWRHELERDSEVFKAKRCACTTQHAHAEGRDTVRTGSYPETMSKLIHKAFESHGGKVWTKMHKDDARNARNDKTGSGTLATCSMMLQLLRRREPGRNMLSSLPCRYQLALTIIETKKHVCQSGQQWLPNTCRIKRLHRTYWRKRR